MTRELILESVWQILSFHFPIDPAERHMFYYQFLEGKKETQLRLFNGEMLGSIGESIYDFILDITHEKYKPRLKEVQEQLNKIKELGLKLVDEDNKKGIFRDIKFNGSNFDYGLKDGDIIQGFGNISL